MKLPIANLLARWVACGIGILVWGNVAWGQQGQWQHRTLPNGLAVQYRQDSTRQLLHMALAMRGGGNLDGPNSQGLAKLYEHLFFQSAPVPQAEPRSQGIYLSHKTLLESQFFGLSLPAAQLPVALQLLRDGLEAEEWPDSTVQAARTALVPSLQAQDLSPEAHLGAAMREALWQAFASRKQTSGQYAQILRIGSAQVLQALAPYRHPANCLLSATGPAPADAFFTQAETSLGGWQPGTDAAALSPIPAPQLTQSIYFQTLNEFATRPMVMLAWPVPTAGKPAQTQVDAAQFCLLAQVKLGRMYQQLVDSGLVMEYEWAWAGGLNPGQLLLTVFPAPERFQECMAAIHRELAALGRMDRYSKEEISAANRLWRLQEAKADDQSIPRLLAAGQAWMLGPALDAGATEITAARMQAFAQAHVAGRPHVAGLLINSDQALALQTDAIFHSSSAVIAAVEPPVKSNSGEPKVEVKVIDPAVLRDYRVRYATDLVNATAESDSLLASVAAMLRAHPDKRVFLNSYSEGKGDGVRNYQLSVIRAKAMRARLVEDLGVQPDQVVIRAYGEAFPEFAGDDDMRNRRLTFEYAPRDAQDNAF